MSYQFTLEGKTIAILGYRGMVGSAVFNRLQAESCNAVGVGRENMDMRDQTAVSQYLADLKPDAVIVAAARVGGILANSSFPADFIYDNLMIASNVIHAAHQCDIQRLVFLGSSCIYPKHAEQPMKEDALLTGSLEPTNQWYAVAKIAGIKLCEAYREQHGRDYISAMPTNLYGPGDNFDLESSHVVPALMRKAHSAKINNESSLEIWGSGKPFREFMHVQDMADAVIFLLTRYNEKQHINVGIGTDVSIGELAEIVKSTVGYEGQLRYDASKPDGTPRKLMDSTRLLELGWKPTIELEAGLKSTYQWFLNNQEVLRTP